MTEMDQSVGGPAPKKVLFYRNYRQFQGGHLKVWHYFHHVLASPCCTPSIYFSNESIWDEDNPWAMLRGTSLIENDWRPERADILFLAGKDWEMLSEERRRHPVQPVINLLQGMRHADPGDVRYRYLEYPALRICVSRPVLEAVRSTGRANGPLIEIPNGVEVAAFSQEAIGKSVDLMIVAAKNPDLGRRLGALLESPGRKLDVVSQRLGRGDFLVRLAAANVALFLPCREEGFYLPALEAMRLGTLVVCPDVVGNRTFCIPEKNCFRPTYRTDAILTEVRQALSLGRAERERLLAEARKVADEHSLEAEHRAFSAVLMKIANEG